VVDVDLLEGGLVEQASVGVVAVGVGVVAVVDQEMPDAGDEYGLAGAVRALRVAPGADGVGVDRAGVAAGVVDDQTRSAVAAVDGTFEVVVVCLCAFGRGDVGAKHSLDLVPDLDRDQGLASSLVLHTAVDHVALVVGVDGHVRCTDEGLSGLEERLGVGTPRSPRIRSPSRSRGMLQSPVA